MPLPSPAPVEPAEYHVPTDAELARRILDRVATRSDRSGHVVEGRALPRPRRRSRRSPRGRSAGPLGPDGVSEGASSAGGLHGEALETGPSLWYTLVDNKEGRRGPGGGPGDYCAHMRSGGSLAFEVNVEPDGLSEADSDVLVAMEPPSLYRKNCPDTEGSLGPLLIDRATREATAALFNDAPTPSWAGADAFLRLALHAATSGDVHVSKDKGGTPHRYVKVWSSYLSRMAGVRPGSRAVGPLLEAFKNIVPEFDWRDYFAGDHPRVIKAHGLPVEVVDAVEADLRTPLADVPAPVVAWTGRRSQTFDKRGPAALAEAKRLAAESPYAVQRGLVEHLNTRRTNVLRGLVGKNAERAIEAAARAYPDQDRRLRALADVRRAQVVPHSVYGPGRRLRSPRVSARSPGVATLKGSVRKAFLHGCLALDLTNAQLAIIGRLLEVGPVLDLLEREGSAWPHLVAAAAGRPLDPAGGEFERVKRGLKGALYSVVFGMSEQGVRYTLGQELSFVEAAGFLNSPVVRALLVARDRELARIESVGWADDLYGRRHRVGGAGFRDAAAGARSALACVAQAVELHLMEPVIDAAIAEGAKGRPEFQVVAWLHDGVTIKASRRRGRLERRLVDLVARRADALGVPTALEPEWL